MIQANAFIKIEYILRILCFLIQIIKIYLLKPNKKRIEKDERKNLIVVYIVVKRMPLFIYICNVTILNFRYSLFQREFFNSNVIYLICYVNQ